jgi:hypothetical protein
MSLMQDDELILIWQQSASAVPDPAEIARLAGAASVKRFDRAIFWRNSLQYIAGLALCPVFVWQILTRPQIGTLWSLVALVCVGFVLFYIRRQHRDIKPLDPCADARSYQAAMLERIDKQIRLLDSSRYWYLGPICMPFFSGVMNGDSDVFLIVGIFAGGAWTSERWGVQRLRAERERIERLYED